MWCLTGNIGRGACSVIVLCHLTTMFGDGKPSRGLADPMTSPRGVCAQTHTRNKPVFFGVVVFIHNVT